ncbi:MAG: alpha-glucosidase [Verrucomicrobia bacterium]|nr:alpha-glucosidase [Verrucomicrobiota bacterium]
MKSDWWRGAIIYQIYPRSFLDTTGDGIGDMPGIHRKMDYIKSLGVDAIWISPFFKSPMQDYGYDVADYRTVDPIFGSNADFETVISSAHERGLKVIIDMVMAHTSDQHVWFKESRQSRTNDKADWYVWADPKPDGTPPNNWHGTFGGPAWQWESRRRQYYLHHYLKSQPNLDWHNSEVVDAMFKEVRYWLDAGVDGLRLDAITTLAHDPELRDNPSRVVDERYVQPIQWQEWIYSRDQPRTLEVLAELRSLTNQYKDSYLLGEIADVDLIAVSAKYTQTGKHLHSCYNFALMEPDFSSSFLRRIIERTESVLGSGWTTWAMSNHDNIRVVSRYGSSADLQGNVQALAKVLLAVLLSLRGGACIYQGEELGLTEAEINFDDLRDPWGIEFWPEFKGRDGCRSPMPWSSELPNAGFSQTKPWLPISKEHLRLAVNEQEKDPDSVLQSFRNFVNWRKQHPALVLGNLRIVDSNNPVLAFERSWEGEDILCIFNLSNHDASHDLKGDWRPIEVHDFCAPVDEGKIRLPAFGGWYGMRPK